MVIGEATYNRHLKKNMWIRSMMGFCRWGDVDSWSEKGTREGVWFEHKSVVKNNTYGLVDPIPNQKTIHFTRSRHAWYDTTIHGATPRHAHNAWIEAYCDFIIVNLNALRALPSSRTYESNHSHTHPQPQFIILPLLLAFSIILCTSIKGIYVNACSI